MRQLTMLLTEKIEKTLFVIKTKYKHDYVEPEVVGVVELSYDTTAKDSIGRNQPKSYDNTQKEVLAFAKKRGLVSNTTNYTVEQVTKSELSKLKRQLQKRVGELNDQIASLSPNTIVAEDFDVLK